MAERKITVTANPTKAQGVSVTPNSVQTYIQATPDTSLYYSTISKKWAVEMGGLVNGEDYSAKHYAGQSAQSATEAQNFAEQAENSKDELLNDTGFVAVKNNLDSIITTAVNIEDINTNAENIEAIKNASSIALGKADRDLSNLTEQGEKHFLGNSQITNCLKEVPQRIKLELNNGVLTLKAGSEVIIPNGFEADGVTPKFDYVTVESDSIRNVTNTSTVSVMMFYSSSNGNFSNWTVRDCYSGTTAPTATYAVWYDTSRNKIYSTTNGGTTWTDTKYSLPTCIATLSSTGFTSIDQVFNGMGYIGSTVWVDKGVKGLISNGRNADGTLNNIEFVTNAIHTQTFAASETYSNNSFWITSTGEFGGANVNIKYHGDINKVLYDVDNTSRLFCNIGKYTVENGKITSFQPKQPFRAVDYNDKSEVSGWAMPSDKYINLTVGASGSTYIAPANGWFEFGSNASGVIQLINQTKNIGMTSVTQTLGARVFTPAEKGDVIICNYTATPSTHQFIYAEGAK